MTFSFLKKRKEHHLLLEDNDEDLKQCDLCENMYLKLKKCENCNKKKLCNSCLKTEKLCKECEIEYENFCKKLHKEKKKTDYKMYQELLI